EPGSGEVLGGSVLPLEAASEGGVEALEEAARTRVDAGQGPEVGVLGVAEADAGLGVGHRDRPARSGRAEGTLAGTHPRHLAGAHETPGEAQAERTAGDGPGGLHEALVKTDPWPRDPMGDRLVERRLGDQADAVDLAAAGHGPEDPGQRPAVGVAVPSGALVATEAHAVEAARLVTHLGAPVIELGRHADPGIDAQGLTHLLTQECADRATGDGRTTPPVQEAEGA